ncbi:MAG TPA: alpha/beta hydrolase-fold protein [Anaerolineales bacterium]|nr:alpha/beta hydrolase-fold protein [Anaerolineales bacterium]
MSSSESTLQRALESGNPVVQGTRVTFIWEGNFAPQLISDLTGWDDNPKPFRRIASTLRSASGKMVWSCSLTVPPDAYIEYAFYNPSTGEKFLDPLNERTVNNGLGSRNNFFYMPQTMPSPFMMRRADVRASTLTRHRVSTDLLQDDGERDVYLYKSTVSEAVPLLVVYDGYEYLHRGKLTTIIDNLIADRRIRPIAVAFLQNGKSRRNVEYLCSDATLTWLEREILPLAHEHLRLLDPAQHPGAYAVLGASAGGLMSMYTGLRMPDIFGKVLCQSGVFSLDGRDFAAVDLIRYGHASDLKIWMDVGVLDEDLLEDNRRMVTLLKEKEYDVTYREFSAAHNYTAWRDDVWHGLEEMFPFSSR